GAATGGALPVAGDALSRMARPVTRTLGGLVAPQQTANRLAGMALADRVAPGLAPPGAAEAAARRINDIRAASGPRDLVSMGSRLARDALQGSGAGGLLSLLVPHAAMVGAAGGLGRGVSSERVAGRVAEMLQSTAPRAPDRLVKLATHYPIYRDVLRQVTGALAGQAA